MRTLLYLALAYLLAACGAPPAKPEPPRVADQATVRLRIEGNRPSSMMTHGSNAPR